MKSLYLVEGNHDCNFLSRTLVNNYSIDSSRIIHYSNEGVKTEKRMAESVLIRQLLNEYSAHDVLIKSEIGKQTLISLLGKVCIPAANNHWELKLTTVFDHDGKRPFEEFNKIFTDIKKTHPQLDFELISDTPHGDIGHAVSYNVSKISGKRRVDLNEIHFFCFYESLEKVIERKFGKGVPIDHGIIRLSEHLNGTNFLP